MEWGVPLQIGGPAAQKDLESSFVRACGENQVKMNVRPAIVSYEIVAGLARER